MKKITRRDVLFLGLGLFVLVRVDDVNSSVSAQSRQTTGQADPDSNKALVRRWIEEGFNRRDLTVVDVLFAEDFTVDRSRVGRGGLKQSMAVRFAAFPDLRVSIVDIVAEGNKVGIWYTVQGTQRGEFQGVKPTGRQANWRGSDLLQVEGGKIVEGWFVDDAMSLLRQRGTTSSSSPAHK